jgi:hypothetical protein
VGDDCRSSPIERLSLDECPFDEVVEIQIIGGISVNKVDGVIFDFDPPEVVVRSLEGAEIDWSVNAMPPLPPWLEERLVRDRLAG